MDGGRHGWGACRRGGAFRLGCRRLQGFAVLQAINDLPHIVEDAFDFANDAPRGGQGTAGLLYAGFDSMRDFAEIHGAGHAGAAFQRMEQARQ